MLVCRSRFALLLAALLAAGCSGSLPTIDQANSAAGSSTPPTSGVVLAPNPGGNGSVPAHDAMASNPATAVDQIIGFRGRTVTLYSAEVGNDGERVASSTMSLPVRVRATSKSTPRVEVMTVYGPRWIARSEVILGQPPPPKRADVR